ncbi:MAG TPA: PilZ domain-containing protein [Bryobacteraceae bacterium]|nr:PilZ domain-containing protein [Bryobacteraceae bacterium]
MPEIELIQGDRRDCERFAAEMPMRILWKRDGVQCVASGRTTDLSRKGVRFLTDTPPQPDTAAELRIEWPFLLQGVCELELRVWGRVVRTDAEGTFVSLAKYEFRTRGTRSFNQASAGAARWSMLA